MPSAAYAPRAPDGRLSLRNRVVHGLSVIVAVVAFLLGLGVTFFVHQTERESWRNRLEEAALNAACRVDTFMQQVQSSMALVGLLDSDYLQDRPQVLQDLLDQTPALLEIIRLDATGLLLAGAYQDNPVMANLFTVPQSSWFLQARGGRSYVGQVQLSAEDEPYLIVALPTPDGGVVAARLPMSALWDAASEIRFGRTGQVYITNRQGEIIAHPDPQVVLTHTTITDQAELESILQAPGNQWHGAYTNLAGVAVMGSTSAIPNNDWIIFAEISRAEAFATTRRALFVLGGGLILGSILTILLTVRLMQREIFQPLGELRGGVKRIGRGDPDHRIEVIRQDEIGQVAEAFNQMAERLHDREVALKQARDEAREASRFKSSLLTNVSHNLRTPLNAILGYVDMLQEGVYGDLEAQQRRATQRILANAKRLLNLINSLLDQAQIEAGKLKLRYESLTPATLLDEVRSTMGILAEAKDLELTAEIASDLPAELIGDAQRIQQIIVNLVENAIKFTKVGGVHVRLYLPYDTHWAIEVSDTGPGIPDQKQISIFEPFRRGDDSPTREHAGIGLGLAIAKQLAILMGGEIHLSSEVGQGSTFTVLLPLNPQKER